MKKLIFILFTICSLAASAQKIEETVLSFWDAANTGNDSEVIKNGEIIINYIEVNRINIDTNIIKYYIHTALSYSNLGDFTASLNLNQSAYDLALKHMGDEDYLTIVILGNIAFNYSDLNDDNLAKELNEKCLKINKKKYGDKSSIYASNLSNLALNYSHLGDFNKSKELNEQCLIIYKNLFGKLSKDYAMTLNNLAMNYTNLGDYQKAKELNEECSKIYNKLFGEFSLDYGLTINNLAASYSDIGDYQKAKELYKQCSIIFEKEYGKEHYYYLNSINNLAMNYSNLGDYQKAKELNEECLKIYGKIYGRVNIYYVLSLNNLAGNYFDLGDFNKSKELDEECLFIYEKIFGKEHHEYATSLNNLASDYSALGDYNKSKELNEQCLKLRENIYGKEHPKYASSLINLANDYSHLGNINKSKELNEQSVLIGEKVYGKTHPEYALSLSNLALNYSALGDYNKSKELNEQCLKIREVAFGKEHKYYVLSLNNLASNYSHLGVFSKSKELNEQCLIIMEKIHGKEHPDYALSLNNLASDYSDLNDHVKSIKLNEQCLQIKERIYGKEHPQYALTLNNLAMEYSSLGDFLESKKLLEQCLEINEKFYGKKHPDYALNLNNLALNYSLLGDYNKAKELDEQCLELRAIIYGKNHPDYALSLCNLASDYYSLENYSKSKELVELSIIIRKNIFGNQHPDVALSFSNLAINLINLGDYIASQKYYEESFRIGWQNYFTNKFGLNSSLQVKYKNNLEENFMFLASLALFNNVGIHSVNDYWMNLNGIISSEKDQILESILLNSDTILLKLYADLKINKLLLGKWNEMTIQDRITKGINTEELENEIEKLESELSRKSKDFANSKREFGMKDVKSNLSKDEVLVDIIRILNYDFKTNKWSDSVKYLIFITDASKDTVPQFVVINEGQKLEGEIFSEYSESTFAKNIEHRVIDQTSYAHFWKPIADKIGAYKTVYVSLGGVYNKINLNTLFNTETEKYLFEEKDIRIVSNARDFVLSKEKEVNLFTNNTASLFGFPNYDGNRTTSVDTTTYSVFSRDLDPFWIDSLSRGGMKVSLLPGTKLEVENISTSFKNKGWDVSVFIKDDASESIVKLVQSPRVMHIATHGYFFEDIPEDNSDDRFMGMVKHEMIQDPLLRSGLLFAGANKTLQGQKMERENGLLSAYEASMLNLNETELVVLSACESGRGEVQNSEGVSGLRKAFSDAGAQNIIMSLWKVDDKVTQEFMSRFYENWLNEKTSIRDAFNRTQLEIKAKYPQPYYWGAFILMGE